jgi:prepilin-type N-terminal cleavage/methylation domain-containing protein
MSIKPQRGFTLIELLIVIAIISILVGFTVVVAGGMLARAKSTKDMANHRIIGQANWNFSTNNNGMLFSPRVMKTDLDPNVVGEAVVDSINSRLWVQSFDAGVDDTGAEVSEALESGAAFEYIGNISPYKSPLDPNNERVRSYSLNAYVGVEVSIDDYSVFDNSVWRKHFAQTGSISQITHPSSTMCTITEDEVRNDGVNINGFMVHPRYEVVDAFPLWWYDFPALWSPEGVGISNIDGSTETIPLSTDALREGWAYIRNNANGNEPTKWIDGEHLSQHDYDLLRKKLLPGHIGSILDF